MSDGDFDQRNDTNSASIVNYDQWIAQIHPLSEVLHSEGDGDGKRHSVRLNVLVLALESLSSISFNKYFRKTHQFFVDQPHTVIFTGYNVIGDAAPANIIPMLTGAPFGGVFYPTLGSSRHNPTFPAA